MSDYRNRPPVDAPRVIRLDLSRLVGLAALALAYGASAVLILVALGVIRR